MKTRDIIILCATAIIIFLGIGLLIVAENIAESPYEQCLDYCSTGISLSNYECTKTCNEDFNKAIEAIANKFFPIMEELIKQENIK